MDSATFTLSRPLLTHIRLGCKNEAESFPTPVTGGRRLYKNLISQGYGTRHYNCVAYGYKSSANATGKKMYRRMSCLVVPPPLGRLPRAIVYFIGGAFIGAIPEITYSYLTELLAKEGYLVISVPYNVTFDHAQAAYEVQEKFNSCLNELMNSGIPDVFLKPSQLVDLPIFGVGHSNGALLHVLVGSYFSENISKANAIVSFNNRPATDAVPYFEQLGPMMSQLRPVVEALPLNSMATSTLVNMSKVIRDSAEKILTGVDKDAVTSFNQFIDQLPSVLKQVTDGVSEFKPTPSENREFVGTSYNVKHTLLVKFNVDSFDETDLLEETLKPRIDFIGGGLDKIELRGTHITPCVQDLNWQVRNVYTPADALGQSLKTLSLNEVRVLSRSISDWFRQYEA